MNGKLTIGENIGDLGGLSIALKAYRIARGDATPEPIDGYTDEQRLFLSWGAIWQSKSRPEMIKQRLATDPHSPNEFRCNQIVRNVRRLLRRVRRHRGRRAVAGARGARRHLVTDSSVSRLERSPDRRFPSTDGIAAPSSA